MAKKAIIVIKLVKESNEKSNKELEERYFTSFPSHQRKSLG
jgi:hypothetical protein